MSESEEAKNHRIKSFLDEEWLPLFVEKLMKDELVNAALEITLNRGEKKDLVELVGILAPEIVQAYIAKINELKQLK